MVSFFRSNSADPYARGQELGFAHGDAIMRNVKAYQAMFCALAGGTFDLIDPGERALRAIKKFAPELHREIVGIAEGANLDVRALGALNARTEIMALLRSTMRSECSVAIYLPKKAAPPIAVQTWDWYKSFSDGWLVWEIPQADGSVTKTVTEYGIVGKAGLNTRGLGLLFTILRHESDGDGIGVPVHVVARAALDYGADIDMASTQICTAGVSASSSLNLVSYEDRTPRAMTIELCPAQAKVVLPDRNGLLFHTNHFLAGPLQKGDIGPLHAPDTFSRHELLRRRTDPTTIRSSLDLVAVMNSHVDGVGLCCHADESIPFEDQQATLATIALDVGVGVLSAYSSGPCEVMSKWPRPSDEWATAKG